jgi:ubiquinone/menaquinone biosynthesis C-methylase UbiE
MLASAALDKQLGTLPPNSRMLDLGCGEGGLLRNLALKLPTLDLHGCDVQRPVDLPANVVFKQTNFDLAELPYSDDYFDFIVMQHVLEHLEKPIPAIAQVLRILKPGGRVFIEVPSNYSMMWSYPFAQNRGYILHYYDDPTHLGRPWTPQALCRLALYYSCKPVLAKYDFSWASVVKVLPMFVYAQLSGNSDGFVKEYWQATGWSMFAVIEKPPQVSGLPPFRYFSLKGRKLDQNFAMQGPRSTTS